MSSRLWCSCLGCPCARDPAQQGPQFVAAGGLALALVAVPVQFVAGDLAPSKSIALADKGGVPNDRSNDKGNNGNNGNNGDNGDNGDPGPGADHESGKSNSGPGNGPEPDAGHDDHDPGNSEGRNRGRD